MCRYEPMKNHDEKEKLEAKQRLLAEDTTVNLNMPPAEYMFSGGQSGTQVGSIIEGRYKILELLGEGGVGQVYKARQLATGRVVAVKMLHRNILDETARLRFHQEARVASAINHPNTAAIYDFGENDSGELYLAMEYIDGENLSARIKRLGQLPPEEVVDIFLQISDALSEAHEKGIVHRDLKPGNIMLTQTKKRANIVKILDFGIAKQANQMEQSLTKTGEVFGTPLYMSPEQCNGEELTAAADIYSIGCMMFEALLGTPPHVGANLISTMTLHCQEPTKTFAQTRPDLEIPLALESITLKCLNKNPDERFAGADELHRNLFAYAETNSVSNFASKPRPSDLAKFLVVSVTVVGALIFSIYGYTVIRHSTIMQAVQMAETTDSWQNYEAAVSQAMQANDDEAVLAIGPTYLKKLLQPNSDECKDRGARLKAAEFLVHLGSAQKRLLPARTDDLLQTLNLSAENYGALQMPQERLQMRLAILALTRSKANVSAVSLINAISETANAYCANQDPQPAFKLYREAEKLATNSLPEEASRQIALNCSHEGDLYYDARNYPSAIHEFDKAVHYQWNEKYDGRWVADMNAKLAHCYDLSKNPDKAEKVWLEALRLACAYSPPEVKAQYEREYREFQTAHGQAPLKDMP